MLWALAAAKRHWPFCAHPRRRGVMDLQEAANGQDFAARASRRSFAARAVSRSSGSDSFRHRSNWSSKDFIPRAPMAYAPHDFNHGSSLATSSATACSWLSILTRTSRCAIWARSATVILLSSKGTSLSRSCGFQHLSVQHQLGIQLAKFVESGDRTKAQHRVALQEVVEQYACGR